MEWSVLVAVAALWLLVTLGATAHILLKKRDPRGAALWIVLSFFLPFLGPVLYWVLGINRVKRSRRVRKRRKVPLQSITRKPRPLEGPPRSLFPELAPLMDIGDRITGENLHPGNSVEALYEGNQAFPSMLAAIWTAGKSVNLTTYILDRDAVGKRIINSLCAAARRGVQVRVLVDGVGTSRAALAMARSLRHAGATLSIFHPLFGLPVRRPSINIRNHRKMLIVDGKVGFTGGLNISSRHFYSPWKKAEPVRDVHFRLMGPVVQDMQGIFVEDWYASRGELLSGEAFFPALAPHGDALVRAVASGPDEDMENIYQLVLGALRSAREHVLIMTPYFIPDRAIIQALSSAVLAGVRVDLVLPEKSDHPFVQRASMAYLPELLETGVRALLVSPPFLHSKLMVVDAAWTLLGSANLDPRSFRLNFEFDMEVYARDLAAEMLQYAEDLSAEGTVLTAGDLRGRPLAARLIEGALKIFSPYL